MRWGFATLSNWPGRGAAPQPETHGRKRHHWRRRGPIHDRAFSREGEVSLAVFCEELAPNAKAIRRLQRQMERKRRAANPESTTSAVASKNEPATRNGLETEQELPEDPAAQSDQRTQAAAHRKSLQGRKVRQVPPAFRPDSYPHFTK